MTDIALRRVGRAMAATAVVTAIAGMVATVALGHSDRLFPEWVVNNGVLAVGFGALVWVMVGAQPRNRVVWAYAVAAVAGSLQVAGRAAGAAFSTTFDPPLTRSELAAVESNDVPLGWALAMWPAGWAWVVAFFVFSSFGAFWFPDGRFHDAWWRWLAWASLAAIALALFPLAWATFRTTGLTSAAVGDETPVLLSALFVSGYAACVALGLCSFAAVIGRYRRSPGEVRSQIRVVLFGMAGFALLGFTGIIIDAASTGALDDPDVGTTVDSVFLLAGEIVFLIGVAVAILKYRLYDLDVILSKALTYLVFVGLIVAGYTAVVVGVTSMIGGRSSIVVSMVATIVVAIALQPARRIVERGANRFVYGDRATPYEVLAGFARGAAESSDHELLALVPQLIVEATGASHATLSMTTDRGPQEVAAWPESHVGLVADRSIEIRQDGDSLGLLSVVVGRGDSMSEADLELLADLASGLGLVFRNLSLTARLRDQVAELTASRERVHAAADSARRGLEEDLDRHAIGTLATLRQQLEEARDRAHGSGVEKVASMLDELGADVDVTIETIRDLARGILPPMLEAEGVAATISERAAVAPFDLVVDGDLSRQPPEVEVAVYFTIIEGLQNVAKHAAADLVVVTLAETHEGLEFSIRDNGVGFAPDAVPPGKGLSGIVDRLQSIDGRVSIEAGPGMGTTITGFVPTRAPVST